MPKFCPSMMCIDFSQLAQELRALKEADVDMLHIDIMDGSFVPNFALGPEDIKAIKKLTNTSLDIHLMLSNPDQHLDLFAEYEPELIYVHAEAPPHLHRTLGNIQSKGIKSGVALNPGTPVDAIRDVLDVTDVVLIMSVNPGFAGQKFIPRTIERIKQLTNIMNKDKLDIQIALDGAVSPQVISLLSDTVDYFILGTSGLFGKGVSYKEILDSLRKLSNKTDAWT